VLLIVIDRKLKLRPGRLLAVYVAGYFTGRFWIEGLRIDPANSGGGWRLNQWVSVFVVAAAVLYLVIDRQRHLHDELPVSAEVESDEYVPQDE
jgi:prolipoprotein diacylglyceryltransferase